MAEIYAGSIQLLLFRTRHHPLRTRINGLSFDMIYDMSYGIGTVRSSYDTNYGMIYGTI